MSIISIAIDSSRFPTTRKCDWVPMGVIGRLLGGLDSDMQYAVSVVSRRASLANYHGVIVRVNHGRSMSDILPGPGQVLPRAAPSLGAYVVSASPPPIPTDFPLRLP